MSKPNAAQNGHYSLAPDGRFVIEDYNHVRPFTNFFPGIAGVWGIPMWAFYVNRGQCLTSFGVESKDKAIMEFQPANKAYRLTSTHGFRTFIKIAGKNGQNFYEPFRNHRGPLTLSIRQVMAMSSHDLTLEEINPQIGLAVKVNYFTIPNEPFTALVRRVTIKNITRKKLSLEVLDGMPVILPYGYNDWLAKNMSRTVEAWVRVLNAEKRAPYFNLKVAVSDRPQVEPIHEGNFYFAFVNSGSKPKLLETIVDPEVIFGAATDFLSPELFRAAGKFKVPVTQITDNKTPCAMSLASLQLSAGEERQIISLIGHIHSLKELKGIVRRKLSADFIKKKAEENKENIARIKQYAFINSSSQSLNLYCGQTFLDNVLRGGLPISLDTKEGKVAFNVFSRKHGDPERDYNHFSLSPTFFSQGNGNFRDVNQNRRNDVWFNRDVKDSVIINFLGLVQPDGYNPLVIEEMNFSLDEPDKVEAILHSCFDKKYQEKLKGWLKGWFQPGELLYKIMQNDIPFKKSSKDFLSQLLAAGHKHESAKHGEGFWSDHWAYNLDLIESYLSVYPEEKRNLLLGKKVFSFYHNNHYVVPREQRFVLTPRGCRQYHAVAKGIKESKIEHDHKIRIHNGHGPVYYTTLVGKLLCLITNKAATFDPSGTGIEMEAEKPNWYDALNGLPGLMGSSVSETFELKRFSAFLLSSLEEFGLSGGDEIQIFGELHRFIVDLKETLLQKPDDLAYWMRSNEIKEHYRSRVRQGIDGLEKNLSVSEIKEFLRLILEKCQQATELAKDSQGCYVTYFTHEIVEYEKLDKHSSDGLPLVWPLKFQRHNLPLFLEGFVHALRVERKEANAREIYETVRASALFDRKLKMYKVNADLSKETEDIGRARVFPRGWLENESIWLHMEYKFLLELLRAGLYKEFFENIRTTMIPFMSPEVYGRSILENSSFLVSSAHAQADLHGRGFVARLSGTTAELVHMFLILNAGHEPFRIDEKGHLILEFRPILPGWLFTKEATQVEWFAQHQEAQNIRLPKDTYAFNFMGSMLVVYHNPKRRDTFGKGRAVVGKIFIHYASPKSPVVMASPIILDPVAGDIRAGKVKRIDVYWQ